MKRSLKSISTLGLRGLSASLALCALFGFNPQTLAATDTWVGNTSVNFADSNWTGTNNPPLTGDTLVFGLAGTAGSSLTDNLFTPGSYTFGGITFNSASSAYTITPGTPGTNGFKLTGGITDSGFSTETINDLVTLGGNETFTTDPFGGNLTFGGVISSSATYGITAAGGGTVTLDAANTYTGTTVVNGATLELNFAPGTATTNIAPDTALSSNGGTVIANGNASTANSQTFTGTTFTAGNSIIEAFNNGTSPTVNLGTLSYPNYGTTQFLASGGAATFTVATASEGAGPKGILWNNYATYGMSDWATNENTAGTAETTTVIGLSSVTGGYTASPNGDGGTVNWDIQSNQTLGSNEGGQTTRFNTPAATTVNVNGKWYITNAVLVTPNMGANNAVIQGSGQWYSDYNTSAATEWVIQNNTSGFLVNSTELYNDRGGGGALTYVQAGPGTVEQNVANGYTGPSYLNQGVDLITADSGLGAPATGATVYLNGGTLFGNATFNLDNAGSNKRTVTLGSDAGGALAAAANTTLTVDGQITGATGTGPLIIGIPASAASATNSNATWGLVPGTGTSTANTTPIWATGTVTLNYASGTSGNAFYGGVEIVGNATLNINSQYDLGGADYTGLSFVNGTLQYNSTLASGAAGSAQDITTNGTVAEPVTLNGPATIDVNDHAITYANSIGNNGIGSLTVESSSPGGNLTLSGNDTFTGGINVNSGSTLTLAGTNINGGTSAINGTLNVNSGATMGNSAITVGGTGILNAKGVTIGTTGAILVLSPGATFSTEDGAIDVTTLNGTAGTTGNTVMTIGGSNYAKLYLDINTTTDSADELVINQGQLAIGGGGSDGGELYFDNLGTSAPVTGVPITIISDPSGGLSSSDFTLGTTAFLFGGTGYALNLSTTSTTASVTFSIAPLNYYFTGASSNSWVPAGNFATDQTGVTSQSIALSSAPYANIFLTESSAPNSNYINENLNGSYSINSLSFTGTGTSGVNSISLNNGSGTNTLTIGAGSSFTDENSNAYTQGIGLVTQAGAGADSINVNVALGSSQTWELDSSSSLTVNGVISDGSTNDSLTKTGVGTLVLANNNTYNGGTTIYGGTVQLGVANALLPTGVVTVSGTGSGASASAGTLDLDGNNQMIGSLSDGGTSVGTVTSSAGTPTLTINNSGAGTTFSGTISGSLGLTATGSSTLTLSGNNSYSGLTTVASGTLIAANNNALGNSSSTTGGLLLAPGSSVTATMDFTSATPTIASLANSGAGTSNVVLGNSGNNTPTTLTVTGAGAGSGTTFSGVISDLAASYLSAIGGLTLTGGQLTLAGANTYTGTTLVNGGTLVLNNSLANQYSVLNLESGSASIGATPTTLTLGALSGSVNFTLANGAVTPAAVALTLGATKTTGDYVYTGVLSGPGSLTLNTLAGSDTIEQIGSGSTGGATYTGSTTINGGTLILGGTTHLTGTVDISGAEADSTGGTATPANLTIQDNAIVNSPGVLYIDNYNAGSYGDALATLTVTGTASLTSSGFSFGNDGTDRLPGSPGVTVTIAGNGTYTDNGAFDLTSNAGSNGSYTTVNLNGGTLAVNNFTDGPDGSSHAITVNFNGGMLEALASDPTPGSVYFLPADTAETDNVQSGGAIIDVPGSFSDTIAHALVHAGSGTDGGLTVEGTGTLTLTGANTYNGATTISSGATLQLGNGTTGNDGTVAASSGITDNGTLIYNRFGTQSSALAISGPGNVDVEGPGSQTLAGTSGYTGSTTVTGTLIVTGGLAATSSLAINGGTVELEAANAINSAAHLSLAGGTLTTLASQTEALGDLTLGAGASTLTLGATSSVINFADSSADNWTGTLAIDDWTGNGPDLGGGGTDEIFIGATADLSAQQLAAITFVNPTVDGITYTSSLAAIQLSDGEIVAAVPEPGTWASLIGGLGMLLAYQRTRRRKS